MGAGAAVASKIRARVTDAARSAAAGCGCPPDQRVVVTQRGVWKASPRRKNVPPGSHLNGWCGQWRRKKASAAPGRRTPRVKPAAPVAFDPFRRVIHAREQRLPAAGPGANCQPDPRTNIAARHIQ
jgi:hypothetical protein